MVIVHDFCTLMVSVLSIHEINRNAWKPINLARNDKTIMSSLKLIAINIWKQFVINNMRIPFATY